MKSYQYILLDWDGNLAKTLHIYIDATTEILIKHGFDYTEAQVMEYLSELENLFKSLGSEDPEKYVEEIREIVKLKTPDIELYPDALFVLETLHSNGKKLALVTASSRRLVTEALEKYNLTSLFDVIVTRNEVKHNKPHPEALELALKLLGATKIKSIMIGDTERDIEAATNTGIDSILFYPPEHKRFYDLDKLKSYKPTYTVSDFRHIVDIIN